MGLSPSLPRIYLSPVTGHEGRNWPIAKWQELERGLVGLGCETLVGAFEPKPWASGEQLRSFLTPHFIGKMEPAHLIALLQQVNLVISNDSGLAHVGGELNLPTVAICGGSHDGHAGFGWYHSVCVLQAPSRKIDDVAVTAVLETVKSIVEQSLARR